MQLKEKYSLKKICNLLGCITNTTDRIEIDNICSIANPKKKRVILFIKYQGY